MNQEQQLKLQAFLDGELPESEAREILAWTQRDAGAAALLAELKHMRQAFSQAEPHLSVPESRDFYWSKIAREIQRQESQATAATDHSVFSALRRWLFPIGALTALAIAAVIVHFNAPTTPATDLADDDAPTVETTLANSDATTYRNVSEGTTLVLFSFAANDNPDQNKKPTAIN